MGRVVRRLLMAVLGVFAFVCYAGVAYLAYRLLRFAVIYRTATLGFVPVVAMGVLLLDYLNLRFGSRRFLEAIPTVDPPAERGTTIAERLGRLCDRMDVDRPTVLFTDFDVPNGFALNDPDGDVIVVDVTLFERLDDDGVEAVLAHELAHLESGDSTFRVLVRSGLRTANGLVSVALSPVLFVLVGLAKATGWVRGDPSAWTRSLPWRLRSVLRGLGLVGAAICIALLLKRVRRLEYAADRRAAAVTGKPDVLADALRTVDDGVPEELHTTTLLPGVGEHAPDSLHTLLSTHPPIEERVSRLRRVAAAGPGSEAADRTGS